VTPQETNKDYPSPQDERQQKKKGRLPYIALGLSFLLIIGGAIGYGVYLQSIKEPSTVVEFKPQGSPEAVSHPQEAERVENPIDFEALRAINADVHAWITVPGTTVDYPICQHPTDDSVYLDHDIELNHYPPGTLFTERVNNRSFTDPVTLIYGHVGYTDIMFATLHNYSSREFFDTHEHFVIYTPEHILTYQVISAYVYDDRHIINTNGSFLQEETLAEYFEFVTSPDSISSNVREGVSLTATDRVVQLSTCMQNLLLTNNRYIVTGLLINEQLTY